MQMLVFLNSRMVEEFKNIVFIYQQIGSLGTSVNHRRFSLGSATYVALTFIMVAATSAYVIYTFKPFSELSAPFEIYKIVFRFFVLFSTEMAFVVTQNLQHILLFSVYLRFVALNNSFA